MRITGGTSNTNGGGLAIFGATRVDIRASLIDGNQAGREPEPARRRDPRRERDRRDDAHDRGHDDLQQHGLGRRRPRGHQQHPAADRPARRHARPQPRDRARPAALWFSAPSPLARIEGSIVAGNFQSATPTGGTPSELHRQREPRRPTAAATSSRRPTAASPRPAARTPTRSWRRALAGTVLPIPLTSPAVDIAACGTRIFDQRGVTRPQGIACDAGAYEVEQVAAARRRPRRRRRRRPRRSRPRRRRPRRRRSRPRPVNQSVVVQQVERHGAGQAPGQQPLRRTWTRRSGIPVGSTVDARKGVVDAHLDPEGRRQAGEREVLRRHLQGHASRAASPRSRSPSSSRPARSSRARVAPQKKPKTRKLWGDGKGKFRTKGQYSAATVRGTKWLVQDGCRYTLTRVTQGSVAGPRRGQAQEHRRAQGQALHRTGPAVTRRMPVVRAVWTGLGSLDGMLSRPTKTTLAALLLALLAPRRRERGHVHGQPHRRHRRARPAARRSARSATRSAPRRRNNDDRRRRRDPGRDVLAQPGARLADRPEHATRITIQGAGANSTIIQADVEVRVPRADARGQHRRRRQRRDAAPRPDDLRRRRQRLGAESVDR